MINYLVSLIIFSDSHGEFRNPNMWLLGAYMIAFSVLFCFFYLFYTYTHGFLRERQYDMYSTNSVSVWQGSSHCYSRMWAVQEQQVRVLI